MSGQSTTDPVKMAEAATDIETAAKQIQGIENTLTDEMRAVDAGWTGSAHDAFMRAYGLFAEQFNDVQKGLQSIHGKLVESRSSYVKTEAENESFASEVTNLLNS